MSSGFSARVVANDLKITRREMWSILRWTAQSTLRAIPAGAALPTVDDMDTVRIADTDREQTAERLHVAVGEGRLDLAAYDERIRRVYGATTRSELDGIVADLRVAPPAAQPAGPDPVRRTWLAVSVLLLAIWAATSLMSGHPLYFWPMWPIGGWGAALVMGGGGRRRCY